MLTWGDFIFAGWILCAIFCKYRVRLFIFYIRKIHILRKLLNTAFATLVRRKNMFNKYKVRHITFWSNVECEFYTFRAFFCKYRVRHFIFANAYFTQIVKYRVRHIMFTKWICSVNTRFATLRFNSSWYANFTRFVQIFCRCRVREMHL